MTVSGFFDVYGAYILPVLTLLGLVLLVLQCWRAARELRSRGLPVRPAIPADALFGESMVSGFVEGTSRMSASSNCLLIWVTRQEFVIDAVFPFNLAMHSHRDYLRSRVPVRALIAARQEDGKSVRITFPDARLEPTTLRLLLKHPSDLMSALKSLKVRVT